MTSAWATSAAPRARASVRASPAMREMTPPVIGYVRAESAKSTSPPPRRSRQSFSRVSRSGAGTCTGDRRRVVAMPRSRCDGSLVSRDKSTRPGKRANRSERPACHVRAGRGPSSLATGGGSATRIHASASHAEARRRDRFLDGERRRRRQIELHERTLLLARERAHEEPLAGSGGTFEERQRRRVLGQRRDVRQHLLRNERSFRRQHLGVLDEEAAQPRLVHVMAEHVRHHRRRHRQRRRHRAGRTPFVAELEEPELVQRRARRQRLSQRCRRRLQRHEDARRGRHIEPALGGAAQLLIDAREAVVDLGREREQEQIERQRRSCARSASV